MNTLQQVEYDVVLLLINVKDVLKSLNHNILRLNEKKSVNSDYEAVKLPAKTR